MSDRWVWVLHAPLNLPPCPMHRTWTPTLKRTTKTLSRSEAVAVASHKSGLWLTLCTTEKYLETEKFVMHWGPVCGHRQCSGGGVIENAPAVHLGAHGLGLPCGFLSSPTGCGGAGVASPLGMFWGPALPARGKVCCTWDPDPFLWHSSNTVPSHQTKQS